MHADLYRIEDEDELVELGLDEAFDGAICLIEWPDRLGRYLPAGHLRIDITVMEDSGSRLFELTGDESWRSRFMTLEEILGA